MMNLHKNRILMYVGIGAIALMFTACVPSAVQKTADKNVPGRYKNAQDTTQNIADINWKEYFTDPYLNMLIDSALKKNQDLNLILQDINIAQNGIKARKGQYLPFIGLQAGAGTEKAGRYTRHGAVDETIDIKPGKEIPEPLSNYIIAANVSWEIDIWKKLRNAKKAALYKYLASVEGKNFLVTNLVAEIASTYYELMALDNQLDILETNIKIQQNALKMVRLQKQAGEVTELAVKKFEAEVLKNRSRKYFIEQDIIEKENRINFLVGRYPQPVERNSQNFNDLVPKIIYSGLPAQLLENRPDIKQAELELMASKLDIKSAKANFYPSLRLSANLGLEAFKPGYLSSLPESMIYSLGGDLLAPLVNRNAIKSEYQNANARQVQAAYNYERTVLEAYVEVVNQLSNIQNLQQSYELQTDQVEALYKSVDISTTLFRSARAEYMEVLMTQRDALQSKFEIIETKKQQLNAMVNIYQALGGGWQ